MHQRYGQFQVMGTLWSQAVQRFYSTVATSLQLFHGTQTNGS